MRRAGKMDSFRGMSRSRSILILSLLLALSVAFNLWQLFFPLPVEGAERSGRPGVRTLQSLSGSRSGASEERRGLLLPARAEKRESRRPSGGRKKDPNRMTEDELLFGPEEVGGERDSPLAVPALFTGGEALRANFGPADMERKYRIKAAIRVSIDRAVVLGTADVRPGQRIKFERLKEFPFFGVSSTTGGTVDGRSPFEAGESFPVSATVPLAFDSRDCGIGVELMISPASGRILFEGAVQHRTAEGFQEMPGKDMNHLNPGASGRSDMIGNQQLMLPQFMAADIPFSGMAAEGAICRIPVMMTFGPATLELTGDGLE